MLGADGMLGLLGNGICAKIPANTRRVNIISGNIIREARGVGNQNNGKTVQNLMFVSRRSAFQMAAGSLLVASHSLSARTGEDEFWNTKPPESWTPEEIQSLTTKSPWAKPVSADVKGYAPLSNVGSGRRGGMMRESTRAGASSGETSPKFQGVVRWASAKPVRLALKLQVPAAFAGHYVISVSGLPIVSGHGTDDSSTGTDSYDGLKSQTSLQVKGQQAVVPDVIQPDKNETSTLYFGFLPEVLKLDGDKTVTFSTVMSPLNVKAKFELKQMKFKGDLSL